MSAEEFPGRLHANPEVMRRYFPTRAPRVSPETIYFHERKPTDSYRIVVQGGSTAAGFPYGRFAGLAAMLDERLEATFPSREVEVISTAMAAVNSYTLLDLADEIVDQRPDAVLVYAGHNEFMGVLGVASGLTRQRSREATLLHLRLSGLRVYQLLQHAIASGRDLLAAGDAKEAKALMTRAARGAEIPHGSPLAQAGAEQWRANLHALLDVYAAAGVPVYLGTVVSNEKDLPPFVGGDPSDAESANAWYSRAQGELDAGRAEAARAAFREARDRDALPFRAPTAFNETIREAGERDGVFLVDVQRRFADASPDGIVGRELLLEHVHPNARGYFLLADAYYEALRASGAIGDWSDAPSREQAREESPITAVDRVLADHAVRELEHDFPFREDRVEVAFPEPANDVERLARALHAEEIPWLTAMDRPMQLRRREGRLDRAAAVARNAAQAFPWLPQTNHAIGRLYEDLGRPARARRYLDRSLALTPSHVDTLRALVRTNRALGASPLARAHLERLKHLEPDDPMGPAFEPTGDQRRSASSTE